MTQAELNRAVAAATGETVNIIAALGFGPLTPTLAEQEPFVVDWDEPDQQRVSLLPERRRGEPAAA